MKVHNPIIVALDVESWSDMTNLVSQLKGHVGAFKVGKQLFTLYGPAVVEYLHQQGERVFLDLKFHDIPNTVAKASEAATALGVFMFNVHISGGRDMVKAASDAVHNKAAKLNIPAPLLVGVTVLTSMNDTIFKEDLCVPGSIADHVKHLALLGQRYGLNGVVASPQEISLVRKACGSAFTIVTPGVRPSGAAKDDQERILTPRDAAREGCDHMVVGRPIVRAANPARAAQDILREWQG